MQNKRERLLIWGNGAVGKGLAVILSRRFEVVLLGPPGSGSGEVLLQNRGAYQGTAAVQQLEAGKGIVGTYSLVAVKAGDLGSVARLVRVPAANPMVCVTNGMDLESQWGPSWNSDVEPAILTAGFMLREERIVDTFQGDLIVSSTGTGRVIFDDCMIDVRITDDIHTSRWAKWLVNSIINPLSALTGLRNDQLQISGLNPLIETMFLELVHIIPEFCRKKASHEANRILEFLLSSSGNMSSMLQDIESHRTTEIDHLTGLCRKKLPGRFPTASAVTDLVKAKASRI